jgi:hypothetical protein
MSVVQSIGIRIYKGNPNLKAPGVEHIFTKEQIEERIRCTQDPLYFIEKYMKIVHVDRGLVPFSMYSFQKDLLRSYIDNRFTIAKLPRQVGKSTVTIAYILWVVLFGPMQNIAILANKASTARDILSKLRLAYEHIPMWMQQGVQIWNKGSIELENGSKVIAAATASSSARGNTFNCVSGDSITKIKIDGEEVEISLKELYKVIANSSKYERRDYGNEVQYVHREQIQKLIHENGNRRLLASECEIREASYNSEKHGWLRFFRKFSFFANKTTHYLSQTFNKICNRRVQNKYDVGLCHDDSYETIPQGKQSRICSFARLFKRNTIRKNSISNGKGKNIQGQLGKTQRNSQDAGASREYIEGLNWTKEISRTCCKNQQESGKDTKNGRGASWHEAVRRVEKKNERCCEGSCSLEQREERNILSRSSRKNASGKTWKTFNRRTQREFEKVEVLTEKGYKDFCGIKKTKKQNTIKLTSDAGEIVCTSEHMLFTDIGYIEAKDCLGRSILNFDGHFYEVTNIECHKKIDVYDLLEVEDTHSYYCNNFLVHQCIFLDEFAFVPQNIAEEFITSVYPTISSGTTTKVIMVSTPNGMNLFYRFWTDAINNRNLYKPIEAHWSVVPGRDEKWAEDQMKQLGQEKFDQEFGCSFLGSSNTLISATKLSTLAWTNPIKKIADCLHVYEDPKPNHIYVISVDTSEGQNLDYSAFTVIDVTQVPYKICAKYYNNKISPMVFPSVIYNTALAYNSAHALIESNSIGAQVVDLLHKDLEYENVFATTNMGRGGQRISAGFKKNAKLGIKMTTQIKSIGCANLKSLVETNKLILEDYDIITELSSFISNYTTYSAEPGCNDDLVMTLVMFSWLTTQAPFKEITNVNVRKTITDENIENMQEEVLPFGYINDEYQRDISIDQDGTAWETADYYDLDGQFWKNYK